MNEAKLEGADHLLQSKHDPVLHVVDGTLVWEDVPALRAINSRLLDDYRVDGQGGLDRWNEIIEKAGIAFGITQPRMGINQQPGDDEYVKID